MNALETAALRGNHIILRNDLRIEWINPNQLSPELLPIVCSNLPPSEKISKLLTELPKYVLMTTFLNMLLAVDQEHLIQQLVGTMAYLESKRNSELYFGRISPSNKLQKYEKQFHKLQLIIYHANNGKKKYNIRKKLKLEVRGFLKHKKHNEAFVCVNAILDTERTWVELKGANHFVLHQSKWFQKMQMLIGKTSHPDHAESVYHARFAAALALDGHLEDAYQHITIAMKFLDLDYSARWNVNVIYSHINVLLQIYTVKKDRKCRGNIIAWIQTCAKQAENLPHDMKHQWLGMLEMKKVFVYLGIDIRTQNIQDITVTENDLAMAENGLNVVRVRYLKTFDDKRKKYFDIAVKKRMCLVKSMEFG